MRLRRIEPGRYSLNGKDYKWSLRLEFSRKYNFGLGWGVDREEKEVKLGLYFWKLLSVWLTFESSHFKYVMDGTQTGVVWLTESHVIQVQLLDKSGMDSSKPALVSIYWNYRDWLFGRSIYSESQHGASYHVKHTPMVLPEGEYDLAMDFYTSYWHRPRSPFIRSIDRVEVTPSEPVPKPGKGENSWDIDDDATFSSTMPVNGRSVEQIAEDFKADMIKDRERYGGKNWKATKLPEKEKKTNSKPERTK